jgi:hypothetical protein
MKTAPLTPRLAPGQTFKLIGLGGVGSIVARYLAVFLASLRGEARLVLIDGDAFEEHNSTRMLFPELGNKADVVRAELEPRLARSALTLESIPHYVTAASAARLIQEGDIVLLCVDNHATRRTVGRRIGELADALLISGGNDGVETTSSGAVRHGTYGNVQVHVRAGGADLTPNLEQFHPEIANPSDRAPDELACTALLSSTPQLLFTNLATASALLNTLLLALASELHYPELAFDIRAGRMRPIELGMGAGELVAEHARFEPAHSLDLSAGAPPNRG